MNVVCFGQQNWNVTWTEKQHICAGLAGRGHRVLYVDLVPDSPAISPFVAAADLVGGRLPRLVRLRRPDLWLYRPQIINSIGWRLNQRLNLMGIRHVLRRLSFDRPVALVFTPDAKRLVDAIAFDRLIYYAVDDYSAYDGLTREKSAHIRAQEDALLRRADHAFGISGTLAQRFRKINPSAEVLENGADIAHFSPDRLATIEPHPSLAGLRGPVIGFVGQIDARMDMDLTIALAKTHPDWSFAFAGRVKNVDPARLFELPNVHHVGFLPYDELPSFTKAVDVFIVPYHRTTLTEACNPAKIYEHLASGKPVVTVPLAGMTGYRSHVTAALDASEFSAAITAHLADPGFGREERIAFAETNDWQRRVDVVENRLLNAASSRRPVAERQGSPARGRTATIQPRASVADRSRLS